MKSHPKKGQPVTVKSGPHKGKTFLVIDYLAIQFQGKDITRIKIPEITALRNRKMPLDSDVIWGKFYPEMQYACVHDSELKLSVVDSEKEDPKVKQISKSQQRRLKIQKEEKKDASQGSTRTDSTDTKSGV